MGFLSFRDGMSVNLCTLPYPKSHPIPKLTSHFWDKKVIQEIHPFLRQKLTKNNIEHNQINAKGCSGQKLKVTLSFLLMTLIVAFWQTSLIKFSYASPNVTYDLIG